ncbi:MAG: molybdopterin-dependent oxidoreductase [Mariprofundaceae bacterium]
MKINRRQFLKGSAAVAAASVVGGAKDASAMETALGNASYNYIKRGEQRERVFSCSPLHAHDNPVEAWVDDDPMLPNNPLTNKPGRQVVELSGVTESVRSRGRVSAAEVTAWLQLYDGDRLLRPLKRAGKRGFGQWREVTWAQALDEITGALAASRPEEIALMHGKDTSAGMWRRFMHTLGSSTILDLDGAANRQAAWRSAWGEAASVPDLAHTHYILNFGTNFFVSHPDYAAEAFDGRHFRRARIVTFDPRCSKTAGLSDEWVPLRPGTDGVVALAMARYLLEMGWADKAAIEQLSDLNADSLAEELKPYTLEHAADISGVPAESMRRIAREFGESGRGCILTGAGTSNHANGYDTERAIMLLPLVAGYIETRGGNCLPRRINLADIEPAPPLPQGENPVHHAQRFPLEAGDAYAIGVLFGYNANPAFEAPAAALWRKTLADESRVGLHVAIGSFRNETWEMADLILPEAHWLERNEPVRGEGSLLPWVGLRQQVVTPPGEVKELRVILRDIIRASGDAGQMRYWQFEDTKQWLGRQLDGITGLKKDGGWKLMAKHSGVWPIYGYLHPEIRRIVDERGEEVLPEYGRPVNMKMTPFPHWSAVVDVARVKGELLLLVHDSDYHAGDASANNKVLAENSLANHLHMNVSTGKSLNIGDGDLLRVTSRAGYLVTRAHLTQTIHPEAVAMHRDGGHWAIGGVASGKAGPKHEDARANIDADIAHNLWWTDPGVHPMDIIPPLFDEHGGGAATATAVRVTKAEPGDTYGTVKVDVAAMLASRTASPTRHRG